MSSGYIFMNLINHRVKILNQRFTIMYDYATLDKNHKFFYFLGNDEFSIIIKFNNELEIFFQALHSIRDTIEILKMDANKCRITIPNKFNKKCRITIEVTLGKINANINNAEMIIRYRILELESLLKILDTIIKNKLLVDNIIFVLNRVKKLLKEEELSHRDKFYFHLDVKGNQESINIENKLIKFCFKDEFEIGGIKKKQLHEIIFMTDKISHCEISLNYFPEEINYFINYMKNVCGNAFYTKRILYDKKLYILECTPSKDLEIKTIKDKRQVLFLRFDNKRKCLRTINLIENLIKNKDVIINLANKHKIDIYNFVFDFIDKMIFELNNFKNKVANIY